MNSQPHSTSKETILKFSHFTVQSIKSWDTEFHTLYPSEFVSATDVEKIFTELFPFGTATLFSKLLFKTIDICDTQRISINELLITFSILTKGSGYERLRFVFRFFDSDNDGFVSKAEMKRAVQSVYDMCGYMFDVRVDVRSLVDLLFSKVENSSGFVNFEDFKKMAERNPEIMRKLTIIYHY